MRKEATNVVDPAITVFPYCHPLLMRQSERHNLLEECQPTERDFVFY